MMARRKPFRRCVLREMSSGATRKDATMKCRKAVNKKGKVKTKT